MKTATYTCRKCQVEFSSRESANEHYSGKWHQFNLMKIFKGLQACPEQEYNQLMTKTTFLQQAKNRVNTINCNACKKSFTSQGSFETHQRSRRHKDNIVRKTAENLRRVKLQNDKALADKALAAKASVKAIAEAPAEASSESPAKASAEATVDQQQEAITKTGPENKVVQYCTACKAAFASERDYNKHAVTKKHKNSLKAFKLDAERKKELDRQDAEEAAENKMQVVLGDGYNSDEWEDADDDEDDTEMSQDGDEAKPLAVNICLFCNKRSANLQDNLGHMERQHSFFVPHKKSGNLVKLQEYLAEKIGALHQCLECSKQFETLRACRLHMLDKPHLSIRFEGEYDQFFEIEKILARIQLPVKPAENDIFAFPMPDGTMLTHRDLRRYFKQRLSLQPTSYGLKRLTGSNLHTKAITHLGKASTSKSLVAVKKENERTVRALRIMHKKQDYKKLDVSVKANKLQKHYRLQVINAG